MVWIDLRKCKIEDTVQYINEKIKELGSLKKVADSIRANESTIRKYLTTKGYKRIGNEFVQIDDTCNLREHTQEKLYKEKEMTTENIGVINLPDIKDNMIYISNEIDTLKDMIHWFKNKDDKSNTGVIEIVDGIKINLPEANIKRTTIRINEKIWDMFNDLVEDNRPIDKHDIMGMALLEYINKYKK
ncbi:MAG: hypothetical protein RSF39_09980 [Romboutsia sp.]